MTLPLSEAIRLGAMLLPQSDSYLDERWEGMTYIPPTGCCALGGAALACGFSRTIDLHIVQFIRHRWGSTLDRCVPHPVHGSYDDTVFDIIHPLNSSICYHWTRERIADFVESIEKQEQAGECLPAEERTVAHVE